MKRHLQLLATFVAALVIGLNPLIGPVATAYAINGEPVQQDSPAEVADSESNSYSTNDPASSPSNKNQDDSVNLAGEENDSSVVADGNGDVLTDSYQYLYIAYPQLPVGVDQVIAFATPNDSDVLTDATLELESTTGHSLSVSATAVSGNAAAFQFGKDYAECEYDLISISYHLQGDATEHSVDLMQCGYAFDIDANATVDDDLVEGSVNSSVYYSDDSGDAIQAATIGDALNASNGVQSLSLTDTAVNGAYVIALDPGHGGVDPGAQGNGKSEADLTWKIAVACKAKLERYGFKVVMSREQSGSYGSNDYLYRVQRCVKQGAQAFVSFHINSGSSAAHGAEVYAPTANGTSYTQASVELAQKVMNNLSALGLTYRGVFQMTVGDEFAVIRCAREQGIPGILIEHGFISNSGDVWNYFSDAGCKRLGEADADAIIAQFPRSSWMDYSAVFDADYYLKNNPDVAKWANNDNDKALQHFINYGMAEGRRGNEAFDVQSYYNEYPDLRAAYGTDISRYYEHYARYGKGEGRHPTGCASIKGMRTSLAGTDYSAVYDPEYYLEHNADVKGYYTKKAGALSLIDDAAVLRHFVGYGMAEGRRGGEAFDVFGYRTRYSDLRKAYGSNLKSYYLHFINFGQKEGRNGSSLAGFEGYIMSPCFSTYTSAVAHYVRTVGRDAYPITVYESKGASSIDDFLKILYEESLSEGVCPEIVYAQAMKETGYLRFGNLVQADQCNFAGIGATGHGNPGYTFSTVREGLRAQVQHLKAYACDEPLNNPCVDPRFGLVTRGCAPKTTDLNGRWAVPGVGYGESLNSIVLAVVNG